MFDEAADVEKLLLQLIDKVRPAAQAEFAPVQELASLFGVKSLKAWDWDYYREKYQQIHHGVTELKVREYFPMQAVMDGMQRLLARLFDVQWLECPPAPRQPASVRLFRLSEGDQVLVTFTWTCTPGRRSARAPGWRLCVTATASPTDACNCRLPMWAVISLPRPQSFPAF
jgi:Zn-dependent oligopeptidase